MVYSFRMPQSFVVFGHGQDGVEDDMDDELPALQEHLLEKG